MVSPRFFALIGFAVLAASAPGATPLPRSSPEAQGVASSSISEFISTAETSIHSLHSVMILRHGHVIAETWWAPFAAQEPHAMYSLSKSFTSTAVGLAIAEGKLSLDDCVLSFFPAEAPAAPSANLRAMRVRDLLTMSTGHHNETIDRFPYQDADSVVKKFLALPVTHKPGTFFVYDTTGSYMLSAIVQKVTGQTVRDYLMPRLFEPLGIDPPVWEASKQGISMGGFGLNLCTEDIAKFGQLYLQKGRWQEKQILPAGWTETATARWMSNGSNPASDWEQGYGFQFWRCRNGAVRGDGASGQFCLMIPDCDAVIAITAATRDLQNVLNVVWAQLLPALKAAAPSALPENQAAHDTLQRRLSNLSLCRPKSAPTPPIAAAIKDARYVFPANPLGYESLQLNTLPGDTPSAEVMIRARGKELRAVVSDCGWTKVESEPREEAWAVSGAWTAADTFGLELVMFRNTRHYRQTLRFAPGGKEVTIETVSDSASSPPPMVGRREMPDVRL